MMGTEWSNKLVINVTYFGLNETDSREAKLFTANVLVTIAKLAFHCQGVGNTCKTSNRTWMFEQQKANASKHTSRAEHIIGIVQKGNKVELLDYYCREETIGQVNLLKNEQDIHEHNCYAVTLTSSSSFFTYESRPRENLSHFESWNWLAEIGFKSCILLQEWIKNCSIVNNTTQKLLKQDIIEC